ncbi:MAG: DNA-processing protein DprA, partial [Treponema sp.]|nr:DNA-processing protein DprA [Treponema sp.]
RNWNMDEIRAAAEKDDEAARKLGIRRVSWREAAYPPLLREIFDPPLVLYYRGNLPDPGRPLVAMVGTRKPSQAGAGRAFVLARELGAEGISVVSGLALGIDTMAHRGNIEGKGRTLAVLGSGIDHVYPSSNRDLARRIVETGGVILSEFPPGTGPLKWNFPARNRIISALARGTLIVEAPEKSGALITARFALEQDRDLWVDKDGVVSGRSPGTAALAADGAGLISSALEILKEWNVESKNGSGKEQQNGTARRDDSGAGLASSLAEYLDIKL